jgi:hypothetical protein
MNGDLDGNKIAILELWPETEAASAPDHVPDALSNFYRQGIRALTAESWDAAGMMFRKVLDVATKGLHPQSAKKPLMKRIDEMRSNGALTQDLAEWAHEIRSEGNDAAHEEEPFTEEDARSLKDFCEYFLVYTYTLPKRIELRRNPVPE